MLSILGRKIVDNCLFQSLKKGGGGEGGGGGEKEAVGELLGIN